MSGTSIPGAALCAAGAEFAKCEGLVQDIVALKRSADVKVALSSPDVKAVSKMPITRSRFILCDYRPAIKTKLSKR